MQLYQSINKLTNFYLQDIQNAIENCEKHLETIIQRIDEINTTLENERPNSLLIKEMVYKNNCLLADNCFFIEEQNRLIEHYQHAIHIIRYKETLKMDETSISEDIENVFMQLLNFYTEKNMTENVLLIKNFLNIENKLLQA